jgi:hypothetical protein
MDEEEFIKYKRGMGYIRWKLERIHFYSIPSQFEKIRKSGYKLVKGQKTEGRKIP